LTQTTDPVPTKETSSTPATLKAAESAPLGSGRFDLVSVSPKHQAASHRGQKMEARGLLYRDTSYAEINLTSLSMVALSCDK
jgi:hypothetical protein